MGRPALLATAFALLAVSAGLAAVAWSGHGERPRPGIPLMAPTPQDDPPAANTSPPAPRRGCLDGLPGAAAALRGLDVRTAASLYRTENKSVEIDNATVLAGIALASATDAAIDPEELRNYTLERVEICSFALSAGIDRNASSVQRVILFRTRIEHNATLSADVALRAIALHASGIPVEPGDVISFRHHEETVRRFDREIDLSADPVLVALQSADPEDRPLLRAIAEN